MREMLEVRKRVQRKFISKFSAYFIGAQRIQFSLYDDSFSYLDTNVKNRYESVACQVKATCHAWKII